MFTLITLQPTNGQHNDTYHQTLYPEGAAYLTRDGVSVLAYILDRHENKCGDDEREEDYGRDDPPCPRMLAPPGLKSAFVTHDPLSVVGDIFKTGLLGASLWVSACATPARMHDEAQLNRVALGCGLALGELIQDEAEKKLLLLIHDNPSREQRLCVVEWAKSNGLKTVFVRMNFQG